MNKKNKPRNIKNGGSNRSKVSGYIDYTNAQSQSSSTPVPMNSESKSGVQDPLDSGVYHNRESLTVLSVQIGCISRITTSALECFQGVYDGTDEEGNILLSQAHKTEESQFIDLSKLRKNDLRGTMKINNGSIVTIKTYDVKISDTTGDHGKTIESATNGTRELRPLVAWVDEESGEREIADALDSGSGAAGWNSNEMFCVNAEKFGVGSSYNPDLTDYTMPIAYSVGSQEYNKASKIADEIEMKIDTRSKTDDRTEEEVYAAVNRPSVQNGDARNNVYVPPGKRGADRDTNNMDQRPGGGGGRGGRGGRVARNMPPRMQNNSENRGNGPRQDIRHSNSNGDQARNGGYREGPGYPTMQRQPYNYRHEPMHRRENYSPRDRLAQPMDQRAPPISNTHDTQPRDVNSYNKYDDSNSYHNRNSVRNSNNRESDYNSNRSSKNIKHYPNSSKEDSRVSELKQFQGDFSLPRELSESNKAHNQINSHQSSGIQQSVSSNSNSNVPQQAVSKKIESEIYSNDVRGQQHRSVDSGTARQPHEVSMGSQMKPHEASLRSQEVPRDKDSHRLPPHNNKPIESVQHRTVPPQNATSSNSKSVDTATVPNHRVPPSVPQQQQQSPPQLVPQHPPQQVSQKVPMPPTQQPMQTIQQPPHQPAPPKPQVKENTPDPRSRENSSTPEENSSGKKKMTLNPLATEFVPAGVTPSVPQNPEYTVSNVATKPSRPASSVGGAARPQTPHTPQGTTPQMTPLLYPAQGQIFQQPIPTAGFPPNPTPHALVLQSSSLQGFPTRGPANPRRMMPANGSVTHHVPVPQMLNNGGGGVSGNITINPALFHYNMGGHHLMRMPIVGGEAAPIYVPHAPPPHPPNNATTPPTTGATGIIYPPHHMAAPASYQTGMVFQAPLLAQQATAPPPPQQPQQQQPPPPQTPQHVALHHPHTHPQAIYPHHHPHQQPPLCFAGPPGATAVSLVPTHPQHPQQ